MQLIKKQLILLLIFISLISIFSISTYADEGKIGVVSADYLNIRESNGTNYKVVGVLNEGVEVNVLEESDGWYKINKGDITGWCKKDYITDKTVGSAWVSADALNLRDGAGESSKVLVVLEQGAKLNVINRSNDWYNVTTSSGMTGWVSGKFLSFRSVDASRGAVARISTGQKLVTYARNYLGVKYVYGGSGPKGFDCSGFVKYVYDHFGYDIERVASGQAKEGEKVTKAQLTQGDLVFFDTDGGHNYINHVGIYIGSGKFIHASSGSNAKKVTISGINDDFYANAFMTARRVAK